MAPEQPRAPSPDGNPVLSQRLRKWRWHAPVIALALVLAQQILEHTALAHLPRWHHFFSQLLFYGIIGPLLAWWALSILYRNAKEREEAHRSLIETHERLQRANERLAFLMNVTRRLAEAEDEDALLSAALELSGEIAPTLATSFIRFDEHGRPLASIQQGDLEDAVVTEWTKRFADDAVRETCRSCGRRHAAPQQDCPLLERISPEISLASVHCLPITRAGRQYGVLNIFFDPAHTLSEREEALLTALQSELSLALESLHLRSREFAALYRLQQAREVQNLHSNLEDILSDVVEALNLDGGCFYLLDEYGEWRLSVRAGQGLKDRAEVVRGLVMGVQLSKTPLFIRDLAKDEDDDKAWSLVLEPLRVDDEILGCLVVWTEAATGISRRHRRVISAVAAQAALLVDHQRLYLFASHQAALAERARLAREIHDGLAQTLGFLKLRTAQIDKWLRAGDVARAGEALRHLRTLIHNAYLDAREAIEGLRLSPGEGGIEDWLAPLMADFQNLCDIEITTTKPPEIDLPPEVHAQLLRIVQEALSNVRKHSQARRVWLDWQYSNGILTLRIIDDGRGFDPEEVPMISRYGLRIMEERSELLGADLIIESRLGHGAQVVVRLPIETKTLETVA